MRSCFKSWIGDKPPAARVILKRKALAFYLLFVLVRHQTMNQFRSYDEPTSTGTPSTICLIHPQAAPLTHNLTFAERERIYHESRGHDGCYKAIGLYQYFFNLLPPGQKLSVRVKNEVSS